jgi:hypothetical protein
MKYFRMYRPDYTIDALPDWARAELDAGRLVMFEETEEASKIAAHYEDPRNGMIEVKWGDYLTLEGGELKVRGSEWVMVDDTTLLPPGFD